MNRINLRQIQKLLLTALPAVATLLLISLPSAQAYYSTLDTGDVVQPGKYRAILEPQLIFDRYNGFNLVAHFDTGLTEESSIRAILGFGTVDYQTGAFYKWVPFPDVGQQPAVGGRVGVLLARVNGQTETSVRFHPLVSKHFETEQGDFTPYASLPLGITFRPGETYVPVQLVFGTEWKAVNFDTLHFMAELGLGVSHSFTYLSGGIVYYFDENTIRHH
jgi:hypothetical protein